MQKYKKRNSAKKNRKEEFQIERKLSVIWMMIIIRVNKGRKLNNALIKI